jgi:hypothetical protein
MVFIVSVTVLAAVRGVGLGKGSSIVAYIASRP